MAYGGMNPGVVYVRCIDNQTRKPVIGARAMLTFVQADSSIGGRLQLYDTNGEKTLAPYADSGPGGIATIGFYWDPLQLTALLDVWSFVRVSVIGPNKYDDPKSFYFTTRVGNERVYQCINLGQVASGNDKSFVLKGNDAMAQSVLSKINDIISAYNTVAKRGIPDMPWLNMAGNEMEMVSLLGGFDAFMDEQTS